MATICCSPPDSVCASCARRAAMTGNRRSTLGQGLGAVPARGRVVGAEQHVVEHGEEGEQAPALQHVGEALARGAVRGQAVDALAEEGDAPGARAR